MVDGVRSAKKKEYSAIPGGVLGISHLFMPSILTWGGGGAS